MKEKIKQIIALLKYANKYGFNVFDERIFISNYRARYEVNNRPIYGDLSLDDNECSIYTYEESYHNGDHYNCKTYNCSKEQMMLEVDSVLSLAKQLAFDKAKVEAQKRYTDNAAQNTVEELMKI